jgi:hypothetical protein
VSLRFALEAAALFPSRCPEVSGLVWLTAGAVETLGELVAKRRDDDRKDARSAGEEPVGKGGLAT